MVLSANKNTTRSPSCPTNLTFVLLAKVLSRLCETDLLCKTKNRQSSNRKVYRDCGGSFDKVLFAHSIYRVVTTIFLFCGSCLTGDSVHTPSAAQLDATDDFKGETKMVKMLRSLKHGVGSSNTLKVKPAAHDSYYGHLIAVSHVYQVKGTIGSTLCTVLVF
jgi:hypothetical protein